VAFFLGARLDATVPILDLPPELAAQARGLKQDPLNPLFHEVGRNYLKSRLRSHPDVARRHHAIFSTRHKNSSNRLGLLISSRRDRYDDDSRRFETLALHGGSYRADPSTGAVAVPIYQTTSYQFQDTDHASRLFALEEIGNIYTRVQNPTTTALEDRIAALEGGSAALAVASGQTASAYSVLNLASNGDNIVSSTDLYGAPGLCLRRP